MNVIRAIFFVLAFVWISESQAQFLRGKIGVDIPMQYSLGINYQQGKHFSTEFNAGIVTSPWNNELYDVIRVPEKHLARKDFLQATTDGGSVLGLSANFHFGNWYAGVFGQRIILNASGTYDYILNSDLLQQELSESEKEVLQAYLNSPLVFFVNFQDKIVLRTELLQLGFKVGRRFYFKNPRWECRLELGMSKNFYANSTSDYDSGLLSRIVEFGANLDGGDDIAERLDFDARLAEVDQFFRDYGYIPTLNVGFTYLLFVPKKVKEEQKLLDAKGAAQ
ncbi:MAG: hypothetical protein RIE58_03165 [Vicingaceae bacterium]